MQFLSVDDVLAIHENTIAREGGLAGLRDPGLLEAAVLMPQQQFGGEYHLRTDGRMCVYRYSMARRWSRSVRVPPVADHHRR